MEPKYSGKKSQRFWGRINAIRGHIGTSIYALGCDLQDLESEVLGLLDEAEAGKTKSKVLKQKLRKARKVKRRQLLQ